MICRAPLVVVAALLALAAACPSEAPDAGPPPEDSGPPLVAGDAGQLPPPRDAGPAPDPYCPPDDGLEENDTRAAARALTSGQEVEATYCGGDDDWYSLAATSGCQLEVRVRFDPAGDDLDLSLYDEGGTLLGSSSTTGDTELISVLAPASGSYAARVRGGAGAAARYRVTMTSTCAADLSCPADDALEENDAQESASAAGFDSPLIGIACPDDDDWFAVAAPVGCAVVADLDFVHSDTGDLDMRFVRPDGSDGAWSLSVSDDEHAVEGAPAGGPLFVRVYGVGSDTNTYRLSLARVCAGDLACPADDPFEPNDAQEAAVRLPLPQDIPAVGCAGDEDWYRFTPTAGCTVNVRLAFEHADGDLDLELKNGAGATLASSKSTDDDEELDYLAPSGAQLYVRAYVFQGDASPPYRLVVSQGCPEPDAGPDGGS